MLQYFLQFSTFVEVAILFFFLSSVRNELINECDAVSISEN